MSEGPFGLGRLSFERLEFKARALEEIRFGGFKGFTLRGGFGAAFKAICCVHPRGDCPPAR